MMLAMVDAAAQDTLSGTLVLVAAAEEEVGGQLGTKWLADSRHLPACDFIVVGEQTGNKVATAHKGVLRATVKTTGVSVHATNPDRGVNAIVAMSRMISPPWITIIRNWRASFIRWSASPPATSA